MICPHCGKTERIHRSHSRGFIEKVVKSVTPYKIYRCHDCNWRGWLVPGSPGNVLSMRPYKTAVLVFLVGLFFGVLLALYLTWHEPGSGRLIP